MNSNEREQLTQDTLVTLGSLKQELKDTNRSIELAYAKREAILEELTIKEKELITTREIIEDILSVRSAAQKDIISNKKKLEQLLEFIEEANGKIIDLNNEITSLKKTSIHLSNIFFQQKKENQELESEKQLKLKLLESLKKEIQNEKSELSELKEQKKMYLSEFKKEKELFIKEKNEFNAWIKEQKATISSEYLSIEGIKKDLYQKINDLKAIKNKLKKIWDTKTDIAFPNV